MPFTSYSRLSVVALLSSLTLFTSCSKDDRSNPNPTPTATPSQAQAAWNSFVQRVSEGVNGDPLGQYVSKATQVPDGHNRATRPKMNAEDRTWALIQQKLVASHGGDLASFIVPEEPVCEDTYYCGGGGGGGGVTPTVTSTFVSSEGVSYNGDPSRNPNNYIMDLEFAKSSTSSVGPQTGYNKINLDLNKGAGGKYIYLTFSRNRVEDHGYATNMDGDLGRSMDQSPVTGIAVYPGNGGPALSAWRPPYTQLDVIWNPTGTYINAYKQIDLNDGAGGAFIYAFLSKSNLTYNGGAPIKEVGVLAGNSNQIQPPAGWTRNNQDLNENAGGDYIYLCYKR